MCLHRGVGGGGGVWLGCSEEGDSELEYSFPNVIYGPRPRVNDYGSVYCDGPAE